MLETPSLSEVQKRTARLLSFEDGLWDLLLGTMTMLLAIYPITREWLGPERNLAFFLGLLLLAVGIFFLLRRKISTPRLGHVRTLVTPALKGVLAVTIVLVGLTIGLVILTLVGPGSSPESAPAVSLAKARSYMVEILALLFEVGVFSAMGYLFGVPRLFLYGWLLGGSYLLSVILDRGGPEVFNLPLGIASGVILLIGASLLVRMLRRYPVREAEA
jgi:hypothetical protein